MLYTLENHEGIYTFKLCKTGEAGESLAIFDPFAREGEPVTVNAEQAHEYNGEGGDKFEKLAIKSIRQFGTETGRTHRAAIILRYNNPADEQRDFIYSTSRGEREIKSRADGTRYTVTPKRCTCPDSTKRGYICKHRIAAWMYEQLHGESRPAPLNYEFLYCVPCGCHHWIEISAGEEVCHGENFNPRAIEGAKIKTRYFASTRKHAQIEVTLRTLGF